MPQINRIIKKMHPFLFFIQILVDLLFVSLNIYMDNGHFAFPSIIPCFFKRYGTTVQAQFSIQYDINCKGYELRWAHVCLNIIYEIINERSKARSAGFLPGAAQECHHDIALPLGPCPVAIAYPPVSGVDKGLLTV